MVAVAACPSSPTNNGVVSAVSRADIQSWLEGIPLKSGEEWYVVCEEWFLSFLSRFHDLVDNHFGPNRPYYSGGNTKLKDKNGKIRRDLIMDMDYRIVPKPCWEHLVELYDIHRDQHEFKVSIIQDGDALGPELYQYEVTMKREHSDTLYIKEFSRTTTFAKIEEDMRDHFGIPKDAETYLRLQPMPDCEWMPVEDKSVSLLDAGATESAVVVIGLVEENGHQSGSVYGSVYGPHKPSFDVNSHVSTEACDSQEMEVSGGFSPQSGAVVVETETASYSSSTSMAVVPFTGPTAIPYGPALPPQGLPVASSEVASVQTTNEPYVGVPGVCGLENMGHTCYLSSGLQCLSNARPLAEYFLSSKWEKDVNKENNLGMGGELAKSFADLLRKLWSGEYKSFRPSDFKEVLVKKNSHFNLPGQHDAQELLSAVLDGLHEDLKRKSTMDNSTNAEEEADTQENGVKENGTSVNSTQLERNSNVMDLIYGYQRSTVKCSACSNVSITREPFQVLSLPLPGSNLLPVDFTIVSVAHPDRSPVRQSVRVSANGSVRRLLDEVAVVVNASASDLWAAKIQNYVMKEEMDPDSMLDSLSDICVYERPCERKEEEMVQDGGCAMGDEAMESKEAPQMKPVVIEMVTKNGQLSVHFALPVVFFPWPGQNEVRVSDLNEYVNAQCARHLTQLKDRWWEETPLLSQNGAVAGEENDDGEAPAPSESEDEVPMFLLSDDDLRPFDAEAVLSLSNEKPLKMAAVWHQRAKDKFCVVSSHTGSGQGAVSDTDVHPLSLAQCLDLFTRQEDLEGPDAVFCSNCRQKQSSCKKIDLLDLPPVLVIHLKRFVFLAHSALSNKVKIPVEFPMSDFDLSPWVRDAEGPGGIYDLVAVSNHHGLSVEHGHYSTLAKNWQTGNWYSFDDGTVTVDLENPDPKFAYLLVYVRKDFDASQNDDQSCGSEGMEIA